MPVAPAYTPTWEEATCPFQLPSGQVEGRTVDCGYLVVPEDRSEPAGRTIRLAVAIFHPPGGASEPDPIVYLVGGPGGSIFKLLYLVFDKAYSPVFVANRDLILFDQRGVGFSEPALDCPETIALGLELLDQELEGRQLTEEEMDELFAASFMDCAEDLNAIADLSAYNTAASSADVNDLRLALGYDQVNLWGGSYGTRLALGVMRDYPEGLRSVVLDSTYPPDVDMYLESPANLTRALTLLFTACAADTACDAAFPNLRQVLFDTVERLDENPVDTEITNPLTKERYAALLDGETLLGLVFQLLYETDALPVLPQIIYEVSEGNLDTVNRIRGSLLVQSTVSSRGMMFSVQCNEEVPFGSLEQLEAVLVDYPELAEFFRDSIVGGIAYHVCTFWEAGRAAAVENEPVYSDIPTLVMQGEYDPITPPAWGRHAAETLSNGYFFEYPGVGHGASIVEGCPYDMMIAFLDDPATVPDGSCIAQMEGVQFVVPAESAEVIVMEPFASAAKGFQGVAPAGWTEAGPGAYVRQDSALDETALVMDAAPMTVDELFEILSGQLGFDPGLERAAQEELGRFAWDLYAFELQGLACDLALAEDGGNAYMVLLVSELEERDALYEQVFRPALEALAPLD
jgi:pimeloyl-ACP methyl ester carboxylesterase